MTRGGIGSYAVLERGIRNVLKGRDGADVYFTTMIDLYKLPKDFPGKADRDLDPVNPMPYVEALERAFEEAIEDRRFIPYIQLYEYETLLFSDPECFRISFDDCDAAVASLQGIVASYRSIEHINDGEATAPSKRIIALLPEYHGRKVDAGPDIVEYIGLATLCRKCPHFDGWLNRLESR